MSRAPKKAKVAAGPLQTSLFEMARAAREERELAFSPPDVRRLARTERALREIERLACDAIHDYGITQETPEKWNDVVNLVLRLMAPIRDKAREGIKS